MKRVKKFNTVKLKSTITETAPFLKGILELKCKMVKPLVGSLTYSTPMTNICWTFRRTLRCKDLLSLRNLLSRMVPFTKVTSITRCATAQVSKSGQITPSTRVNGAKTRQMAVENSGTLTVTSMRVSGKTIKPMASVSTFTSMELNTKATGRMTFRMAKEWRAGKTAAVMKVDTKRA